MKTFGEFLEEASEAKKCPDEKPRLCNNPRRAAGRPECKCWL